MSIDKYKYTLSKSIFYEAVSYPSNDDELKALIRGEGIKVLAPIITAYKEGLKKSDEKDIREKVSLLKNYYKSDIEAFIENFFKYVTVIYDCDEIKNTSEPKVIEEPVVHEEIKKEVKEEIKETTENHSEKQTYTWRLNDCDMLLCEANKTDGTYKVYSNKTTVYENFSITIHTDIKIVNISDNISRNIAYITDSDMTKTVAIGSLLSDADSNKFVYFVADSSNIKYNLLSGSNKFKLILVDKSLENISPDDINSISKCNIYCKDIVLRLDKPKTVDNYLCIDFGTCNTAAGTYGVKDTGTERNPELVDFINSQDNTKSKLLPTIIYVKHIEDDNDIEYLFGYDAQKAFFDANYTPEATIIFDLKTWVGCEDNEKIEVCDEKGRTADVSKALIVKKYLEFVIHKSEEYFGRKFKKLHFTAPVKMKSKFIKFMEKHLDYEICPIDKCVDEAVAVIFDDIFTKVLIDNDNEENNKLVVLDCGGGTTDLAACKYDIFDNGYKEIRITTQSENGNSEFGGNNITYKIMQLIKIRICEALVGNVDGIELDEFLKEQFTRAEDTILQDIDCMIEENLGSDEILDKIYGEFNKVYEKCEDIIPTCFEKDCADEDRPKIKRNFYFLWNFAEQVKLLFYREKKVQIENDNFLNLTNIVKERYLYKNVGDAEFIELETVENPMESVEITINEIRNLIIGDMYVLISNILPECPEQYNYFLSGQSCKINLFNDLLKEFIPGKKLRCKVCNPTANVEGEVLKLKCINGAVKYMAENQGGSNGVIKIDTIRPKKHYAVSFKSNADFFNELEEFSNDDILYNITDRQIELDIYIKRDTQSKSNMTSKNIKIKDFSNLSIDSLDMLIKLIKINCYFGVDGNETNEITQAKVDRIIEHIRNAECGRHVFITEAKDGYSFILFFIDKLSNNEYKSDIKQIPFEEGMKSFFDGTR